MIDSSHCAGHLTYAECVSPERASDEILIFTHICHPGLANDNLSGIAVTAILAARSCVRSAAASVVPIRIRPGTIGSITWLLA